MSPRDSESLFKKGQTQSWEVVLEQFAHLKMKHERDGLSLHRL